MQTLIMLCLKDKDSIWEVRVTEQKALEQYCWHLPLLQIFPVIFHVTGVLTEKNNQVGGLSWAST